MVAAEDFQHPLHLTFYVENFGAFISLVFESIRKVCPQADYLMRLWQINHAEKPDQAEKVLSLEGRDTYERTDNYNVYGLFCYFAMKMRRAFF